MRGENKTMTNLGNVFCTINRRGGGNEKYSMREGMEGFRHIMIKEIDLSSDILFSKRKLSMYLESWHASSQQSGIPKCKIKLAFLSSGIITFRKRHCPNIVQKCFSPLRVTRDHHCRLFYEEICAPAYIPTMNRIFIVAIVNVHPEGSVPCSSKTTSWIHGRRTLASRCQVK